MTGAASRALPMAVMLLGNEVSLPSLEFMAGMML